MKKYIFIIAFLFFGCDSPESFCTDARYTEQGFLFETSHYSGFVDYTSDSADVGRIYIVQYEKCGSSVCLISYTPAEYSNGDGIINPC